MNYGKINTEEKNAYPTIASKSWRLRVDETAEQTPSGISPNVRIFT